MATPYEYTHWNYYLALEQDLFNVSMFVEFSEDNYATYSIEFAHIILAAASEADVLLKQICLLIEPKCNVSSIIGYRKVLAENRSQFFEHCVVSGRYGMSFQPWNNWPIGEGPEWWRSYNKVKHHRSDHFEQANLFNALQAVSALLIANLEFISQRNESDAKKMEWYIPGNIGNVVLGLHTQSRLFTLHDPFTHLHEQFANK